MTQDADHDPEFEAFLRRRSPMHRRLSQVDHAEPSEELDRIVLDRARDAIGAPSREPIYRKSRWAMPLGLAATILIAFTVVLNIDHRRVGSVSQHESNASARLADTPPAAPATQRMERARAEAAGIEEQKLVAKSELAPAAPAAAGPAEQPALVARGVAERSAEAEVDDAAFDAATAAEIVSRRDTTTASSSSGVVSWGATSATSTPPSPAPAPVADFRASPDAWLLEIKRLQAAGNNEEADREMTAFRRAHPAHPGYSLAQPPTR